MQRDNTSVILVRHGQTEFNAQRRVQGHLDEPLNDTGMQQARDLIRGLAGERPAAIYCSDLTRTRQTLAPYAQHSGLTVSYDESLRERHFGRFEGLTVDEVKQSFPEGFARFRARDPDYDLDGGESIQTFYDRSVQAISRIASDHLNSTVLVVTHGGVLDCVQRWARDLSLAVARDFEIHNASINRVRIDQGRCQIDSWGEIAHLESA